MNPRALLLCLIGLLTGWIIPASAHESRPAYLEIRETAPARYSILWRTPVLSGMKLPVALRLPEAVRAVGETVVQRLSDSLIERRVIETDANGLAGQQIDFVGLQATITDVLVRVQWLDGSDSTTIVRPSQAWITLTPQQRGWAAAMEYLRLGVEHILTGADHIFFVLTLLILTQGTLPLVKTITAFTVAHSITLSLATFGFVHVPQRPVEAVVALSIAFVAMEIIRARRGSIGITARAPWVIAFMFGLLHGFGFAGALTDLGLPQPNIPMALLFFNLGVEVGQLLFVAAVLLFMFPIRKLRQPLPQWTGLVPPYAMGSIAMFWVIQRVAIF